MSQRIWATIVAVATLGWGVVAQAGVAAAAPTVSPPVGRTFVGADGGTYCQYGYLCAYVWANGGYYRLSFTRCNIRYHVSGWHRHGYIVNDQFGGVIARFYDRYGGLYATRRARGVSSIDWQPVWSLRVC